MVRPSGDQRGLRSGPACSEIFVSAPPSAEMTQTSVL